MDFQLDCQIFLQYNWIVFSQRNVFSHRRFHSTIYNCVSRNHHQYHKVIKPKQKALSLQKYCSLKVKATILNTVLVAGCLAVADTSPNIGGEPIASVKSNVYFYRFDTEELCSYQNYKVIAPHHSFAPWGSATDVL